MDEREDSKIMRRRDEEHVSIFKARAGMGAVIMEGQEIGAVVRYIEALEQEAARRTTPDREAGLEDAALLMEQRAAEIEACGGLTAGTMARIYRDEASKIRALKTAPTSDKGD